MLLRTVDPTEPAIRRLVEKLDEYRKSLYPLKLTLIVPPEKLKSPQIIFLAAYENQQLLGCGGIDFTDPDYAEIRKMYVEPAARRKGVASLLLNALEQQARQRQYHLICLETGKFQEPAMELYQKHGYQPSKAFGSYQENPYSRYYSKTIAL
ncbi:GNAT family N-acetyltransferase [Crocosphaera sp. XPORK-15E]|uniref:GNAT family N-acetyltransferase n=1 Tax=Crocosphaera sp. XPORK-15E TaxID=3110247 RepID=UPI002B1EFA21|nr:GNAT family N-acetyltransferase [Crocosphaera sp. XPORK-15E]MEA5536240.1 GNAT family N-acetyltransferase [Crocosphaera sp. XPORK-15E]